MPVHGTRKVIVLRRTLIADPEDASAQDLWIQVKNLTTRDPYLGSNSTAGDGTMFGRRGYRPEFEVRCWGFSQHALGPTDEGQDYTRLILLKREIFRADNPVWYTYLYRTYVQGGNPSLGPIPRAMYDPTDWDVVHDGYFNASAETSDGYPYDPVGILPLQVVLDGQIDESPNNAKGIIECTFTMKAANPIY